MKSITISLERLVTNTKSYLYATGYSEETINRYNFHWRKLLRDTILKALNNSLKNYA